MQRSTRERHDYNDAKTKLTDDEWMKLASRKRGPYVVLVGERVEARDRWFPAMCRFSGLVSPELPPIRVMSHDDYVATVEGEDGAAS